jgi:hypothetical protein
MYKKTYNKFQAKPAKRKRTDNISEYEDNKLLYTFVKQRSPHTIKFVEDKEDAWFIYVITFKNKSGLMTDLSMIIASDLETWVSSVKRMGFELKK